MTDTTTGTRTEPTKGAFFAEPGLPAFTQAVQTYQNSPNPLTLLRLNQSAIPLMEQAKQKAWKPADGSVPLVCDFVSVRAICDRRLSDSEVGCLSGCLGYALRATLATGENALSEAHVQYAEAGNASGPCLTVVEWAYDSRLTIRTDPDPKAAFDTARAYLRDGGSPVRSTDREGPGTKGTRLTNGLDAPTNVAFYVR